jgi:hypothetical protein
MRRTEAGRVDAWLHQLRCAWAIAKKNARIYYLKGPVISYGIVFPLFFYLAFAAGHDGAGHRRDGALLHRLGGRAAGHALGAAGAHL